MAPSMAPALHALKLSGRGATVHYSCYGVVSGEGRTFAAAGDEVFVVSSETGVDGIEALGDSLVLPHQYPVLQVPQVDALMQT